jgi:hypothetical protein
MAEFNPDVNKAEDDDGAMGKSRDGRLNCVICAFYEVTWDPDNPRGCVLFGFKGRQMPCDTVLQTTGRPCPSFTPKK